MSKNITILFGENSFGRKKRLKEMENSAKAEGYLIEKIDSEDLDLNKFLDLISGISLLGAIFQELLFFHCFKITCNRRYL